MSRSNYTDDDYGEEFPGQLQLYRANVKRSIRSKQGQARLRELRDALEAMPEKALAAGTFLADREACALGVWARTYTHGETLAAMRGFEGDDVDTSDVLGPLGWPKLVVWDLIFINDDGCVWNTETAGMRYERVLAWVKRHIYENEATA